MYMTECTSLISEVTMSKKRIKKRRLQRKRIKKLQKLEIKKFYAALQEQCSGKGD